MRIILLLIGYGFIKARQDQAYAHSAKIRGAFECRVPAETTRYDSCTNCSTTGTPVATQTKSREARTDYFPKDAVLTLDGTGHIDLTNNDNLNTLKEVFRREHDAASAASINTDQVSAYWNLVNGETVMREHIAKEEMLKRVDTATAEINQAQWGANPQMDVKKSQAELQVDIKVLKEKADAMAKAHNGEQNIEADYVYNADVRSGRIYDMKTADDRNEAMPGAVYDKYQELLKQNPNRPITEVDQVLYKDDGQGHMVADKLIVWHIKDSDALVRAHEAARGVRHTVAYDGDHSTVRIASMPGGSLPSSQIAHG